MVGVSMFWGFTGGEEVEGEVCAVTILSSCTPSPFSFIIELVKIALLFIRSFYSILKLVFNNCVYVT